MTERRYHSDVQTVPPGHEARLRELLTAFLAENAKLNLSALRTEDAAWHGNILDSLPFLDLIGQEIITAPRTLLDVGTGGGFPLLPLAVTLPRTQCTGMDSIGKKVEAVKRIASALRLENVTLVADRAEALAHLPAHREKYDVVVSRAVAPLNVLLEYVSPLARQHGYVVLWKSLHAEEEIAASEPAQKALLCRLTHRHVYDLGGDWGSRQLLVFKREGATPRQYPRDVGEPKKSPIA